MNFDFFDMKFEIFDFPQGFAKVLPCSATRQNLSKTLGKIENLEFHIEKIKIHISILGDPLNKS